MIYFIGKLVFIEPEIRFTEINLTQMDVKINKSYVNGGEKWSIYKV